MDAADIRSVSLELCHVDLELQTSGYSRSEDGYKAYCASYLLCKKYGVDVRSCDLSGIQGVLAGKEPREIAGSFPTLRKRPAPFPPGCPAHWSRTGSPNPKNRSANVWRKEEKSLALDQYEHGVVINALNKIRNDLLEEQRPSDIVDEVLLKTIDAPVKKGTEPE